MTISEYVRKTGKSLQVTIAVAGDELKYAVTNTDLDGQPLTGWDWSNAFLHATGTTLEAAFASFLELT